MWIANFRGGHYDEWEVELPYLEPPTKLVLWVCADDPRCEGHATPDPECPAIELKTAEVYRRIEVDVNERHALYEIGDGDPAGEQEVERELVVAGAGLGEMSEQQLDDFIRERRTA